MQSGGAKGSMLDQGKSDCIRDLELRLRAKQISGQDEEGHQDRRKVLHFYGVLQRK